MNTKAIAIAVACAVAACRPAPAPTSVDAAPDAFVNPPDADVCVPGSCTATGCACQATAECCTGTCLGNRCLLAAYQCQTNLSTTVTCSAQTEFCYVGSETGFWGGPGTIQIGCDSLPPACASDQTCDCVLRSFAAGFCTCTEAIGGIAVACSFV